MLYFWLSWCWECTFLGWFRGAAASYAYISCFDFWTFIFASFPFFFVSGPEHSMSSGVFRMRMTLLRWFLLVLRAIVARGPISKVVRFLTMGCTELVEAFSFSSYLHLKRGSIVVGRTDPGTVIKLQQIQERVGAGGSKKAEAFEVSIQKLSFADSIKGSVYGLLSAIIWPGPVSFLLDHRTTSYWKSLEALNSLERLDSDSYKSTGTATASTSTSLTSSPAISPSTSQTGSETTRVDGELLEP
ncbi:hypothetical protein D9757_003227 [Collybiopsis confluens]|uniref:Uncharacterized protein n=1 Tax=Collybiopsis confluens TaxID=2823264 RepID=A0A8H5HZ84_9AGAR|nr:hypothetical protein D9757_003227 [Collybiopsis confluens]